ncbi:MAG: hypothetical protein HY739_11295 [Desulfobacterales bacterium]|nr:hypothetical protein [Desulfobacterales bacterium]
MKQERENLLILDSGDLLFKDYYLSEPLKKQLRLKADLIIESFNRIGCSAFNVGDYDLAMGVKYLMKKAESAKFPFLSANLIDKNTGKPLFQPYIIKDINGLKVGILGLVTPDIQSRFSKDTSSNLAVKDPFETAKTLVSELKGKTHLIIALTHLGLLSDKELAKRIPEIDIIIGGHDKVKLDSPIIINNTLILQAYKEGQYLGILDLTLHNNVKAEDFIKKATYKNVILPLGDNIKDDAEISDLIKNYKKGISQIATEDNFHRKKLQAYSPEKGKVTITNIFVGDKVCRTCHPKEYELWKETKHARAYQSLINKNQQFDLECIGCHTTGYDRGGGFSSLSSLGKFKGVQCEECHGAGDKHQRGGDIVKSMSEDVCLRCHTKERSPGFNYKEYLEAVQKNLFWK